VSLDLVFKRKKERILSHASPTPKASLAICFDGTIKMVLPKKPLIVRFKKATIDEAVNIGFDRLFKEIETYKGKHFTNNSEFYNHDTIRKVGTGILFSEPCDVTRSDYFAQRRKELVEKYIKPSGIKDKKIIKAMLAVPRHEFVQEQYRDRAYVDASLSIGEGQTISQPSLVALMTELLGLSGEEAVLEIGTGSGYQAAILARLAKQVYTVEIIEKLALRAGDTLKKLGYDNVQVELGNGTLGLPKYAPFDAIIVAAAGSKIPKPLIAQLKEGGRIVMPVGDRYVQELKVGIKEKNRLKIKRSLPVAFVPLKGRYG